MYVAAASDAIAASATVETNTITIDPDRLLDLKPGDVVRYRHTDAGVIIDKLPPQSDEDALASFSEWASNADERAYADL